jgi:hypothetical protein
LIKACDLKRNDNFELLHTAEAFVSAIKAKDNYITPAILRLNELQIAIRKRELNTLEKEELQHIVKSNRGNLEIKIGAYILLGAYTEARLLLSELDKEHQEIFCGYPIYNILLNNQQMIDIKDTP